MAFYLDLFTPETWAAFKSNGSNVSGFRERQHTAASRIKSGDVFICYVVRLMRWCGILEVQSEVYRDSSPIYSDPDPFVLRFKVAAQVALELEQSVPIYQDAVWKRLSFTKDLPLRKQGWAQFANLRQSLVSLPASDAEYLMSLLTAQTVNPTAFPLTPEDRQRLTKATVQTVDRTVVVEVPADDATTSEDHEAEQPSTTGVRESHRVQAILAKVGADMGFYVWVPRNDRQAVLDQLSAEIHPRFLSRLPLNYDDATLRTVEQIDVIWLKNRSMARAFEVEHTTAIYSGLLRMADLLALQPNMDIALHIVAPDDKRDKVLKEIKRPVFSLLDRGPLYESCSFLPYSAVKELSSMPHLTHMSDSILEEYEEFAEDE